MQQFFSEFEKRHFDTYVRSDEIGQKQYCGDIILLIVFAPLHTFYSKKIAADIIFCTKKTKILTVLICFFQTPFPNSTKSI